MALLTSEEIAARLTSLEGWRFEHGALRKRFVFAGFPEAVAFVARLVPGAESADHHPDVAISYRRVDVSFVTHSEGGVTLKDFEGAARVEAAAKEQG